MKERISIIKDIIKIKEKIKNQFLKIITSKIEIIWSRDKETRVRITAKMEIIKESMIIKILGILGDKIVLPMDM